MRILVSGGSGFVGRALVRRLRAQGHQVFAGSRGGQAVEGAEGVTLDVTDYASVLRATERARPEAVAHLVGIIAEREGQTFEAVHVEGTRHMLAAAPRDARFLHMSALGAQLGSPSGYFDSKARAEGLVRASGLSATIFRPSLIFGVGDDFFGKVLKNLVEVAPLAPVIGDGHFPFRPVSVQDVAGAFSGALTRPATAGETYDLTGPDEYTFEELLKLELGALGKRKPLLHVPLWAMNLAVPAMQLLPNPPITRDQYLMLLAGNTADPQPASRVFDLPMNHLRPALPEILGAAGIPGVDPAGDGLP